MIGILADHNIEGQATLLWSTLDDEGWLDLVPMRLVRFTDAKIPRDSPDRVVWHMAQDLNLLLLTANRNMQGEDSLEQTIREDNQVTSLPVITIGKIERMANGTYRAQCAARLAEIALYLDNYLGTGRLFIP